MPLPTTLTSFDLERAATFLWQLAQAGRLDHASATTCANALLDEANTEEAQARFDKECRRLAGLPSAPASTAIPIRVVKEFE